MTSTQTKLTFAKRILGALTTLVLVACGGGGGGAGSGGGFLPDNNGTPTPSYTLTVSGKNAGGTATNEFSASSPLTIEVLVEDTSTNTASVVSGAVVELQSTVGTITPANASALTNAAGIAEFTLGFNQEEGAGTVTASYVVDGTTYSGTFNVQSIIEPSNEPVITLSLAATNSTGDTVTTLSQRSPATLTASFLSTLDGVATPISGELVTINTNVGDVSPSNNTALTDANGDAVFIVSFNGTEGAGSVGVTASLDGVAYTDTLNLQAQDTGAPYEISIQILNDNDVQTNVLSSSQPLTVQALVRRIDGGLFIPVGAGESVQLTTTLGSIAGNGSALTNAQGIATFDITFDGTVGAGSVTASYDSADGAVAKTSNIQSVATATGYALDLVAIPSAGMDANTFAQGAPIILRATLSSPTNSVANQAVTLNTDVGQVSPANGVTLTDANGVAIFEVAFNDVIGAGVATATFNPIGGAIGTSVNLEAVVADPTAGLEVSTFADDGSVTTEFAVGSPMTVRVQLTDGVGAAALKAGEIINLSSSIGTLNAASKLTDSNGIATFELRSEGVVGAGTLEATYQTALGLVRAQQTVQSIASEPYVLDLVAAGGPMTLGQDILLTATLTAPNGGAAAGQILNIATDLGVLDKASAVTDGSGKAVFTLSYNDVVGAGVVTVSFTSGSETFTSSAVVEAESPTAPSLTPMVEDQAGVATRTLSSVEDLVLEVTVRDRQGNLVGAGEVVFASTSIGTLVGNGSALTDEFGVARFTLQHDGTVGAGVLTASYSLDGQTVSVQRTVESVATNQNYTLTLDAAVDGANFSALSDLVVNVTLASTTGAEVANQAITLTSDIGSVAGNGRALTNGAGVASFVVSYNDILGAGTVTASFTTNDGTLTDSANVEAVDVSNNFGLDFNLSDASGSFSLAEPLTVQVQLTDGQGDPLANPGEIINLSSSIGNLDAGSKLTDANGIATFVLSSTGAIGAGTLEATYGSDLGVIRAQQTVQSVSTTPYIITVTSAGGPMTLGQDITLTVNLEQPNGTPAVGEIVTLQSTIGSLDKTSALTNGLGDAVFVLSYADQIGAGIVTASFNSGTEVFSNTATVEAVAPAGPTVSLATTVGGVASTQFDASSDMTVVVTVAGSADYAVSAGDTVSLASTIGTVAGNGTALLVNNAGNLEATFTVSSDGTVGAGTLTASIDVGGTVFDSQRNVQAAATDTNYQLTLYQADGTTALNGSSLSAASPLSFVATLEDISTGAAVAVANELVSVSSTIGSLNQASALTGGTGEASFVLNAAGVIGAGVVTATFETSLGTVTAQANVSVTSDAAVSYTVAIGNGSNGWVFSDANPLTLDVTVAATDASDLSGQLVTLTTDLGTVVGNGTAVLADVAGIYTASFTVDYASVVGAGTLTASFTAAGETYVDTQSIEATSSEAYTLSIAQDVATVTLGTPMTLTVSLDDAAGNSVASQTVNLSSTIGTLNRASGVTDVAGETDFVLSYGGASGDGLVTATYQVNGNTYTQTLRVVVADTVPATVSLATTVGGVASTQFDASSDMTVVVTVAGSADYAVSAGDTVSLASTIGTVAGNGTALLVDNAGNLEATFTVSSDGTVGAGTLTASIDVGGEVFSATKGIESLGAPYELSALTFVDSTSAVLDNAIVSSVSPYRSITASVTLTDLGGNALENRLIQFVSAKGQLTPIDGYVLTDATGVAQVTIAYTDDITSGIGELSASYVSALGTVSSIADIQVVSPNLVIGSLEAPIFSEGLIRSTPANGSIVNQGSAVLEVDILDGAGLDIANADNTDLNTSEQIVAFNSTCLDDGSSTLSPANPIATSSGQISVTYTAGPGCIGEDEVIATLQFGASATAQIASQVLTIAAAVEAVSIEAVDTVPTTIAIAGTGAATNLPESSTVRFRVVDENGAPVANEQVDFSLSSSVGGVNLSALTLDSGADGLVTVTLNSGSLPVQAVVTAELNSTGQLVTSDIVSVSTGIPDQDSLTLFATQLAIPSAADVVNTETTVSVRLADRYNNVVPDGSFVYFTTEFGAIGNSCEITDGSCNVTWISQDPYPSGFDLSDVDCDFYDIDDGAGGALDGNLLNDSDSVMDPCPAPFDPVFSGVRSALGYGLTDADDALAVEQGSRSTILASTTGEESFTDEDGDGLYSDAAPADTLGDAVGEPFLDTNENGVRDAGEYFEDSGAVATPGVYDDGDALDGGANIFTGIACAADAIDCSETTLSIFDNLTLVLSPSSDYYIALVNGSDQLIPNGGGVSRGSYVAYISDRYNNQPAGGATVSVTATGECSISSPATYTVPDGNAPYAYSAGIEIGAVTNVATTVDSVTISISNPGGSAVSQTFPCTPL
jgi:arginine repressor